MKDQKIELLPLPEGLRSEPVAWIADGACPTESREDLVQGGFADDEIRPLVYGDVAPRPAEPVKVPSDAWGVAEKVRRDLDRQGCPDAYMRIAVEPIVKHYDRDAASIHLQDLKNALATSTELREQITLMDEHMRGEVWRWQADGTDDLASMGNRMGILIYACDLRALLARYGQPAANAVPVAYLDPTGDDLSNVITAAWKKKLLHHSLGSLEAVHGAKHVIPLIKAAPVAQEPIDLTLLYEKALSGLIDKIVPGLDTGDVLADARQALAAREAANLEWGEKHRDRADKWMGDFKNFHRMLCERFGYSHDEQDWYRDQVSLVEHIAAQPTGKSLLQVAAQSDHSEQDLNMVAAQPSVPDDWLKAVQSAYGYLWMVNNEPGTPNQYSPEKAAYEARKLLRNLLTHAERGDGINAAILKDAPTPPADKEAK